MLQNDNVNKILTDEGFIKVSLFEEERALIGMSPQATGIGMVNQGFAGMPHPATGIGMVNQGFAGIPHPATGFRMVNQGFAGMPQSENFGSYISRAVEGACNVLDGRTEAVAPNQSYKNQSYTNQPCGVEAQTMNRSTQIDLKMVTYIGRATRVEIIGKCLALCKLFPNANVQVHGYVEGNNNLIGYASLGKETNMERFGEDKQLIEEYIANYSLDGEKFIFKSNELGPSKRIESAVQLKNLHQKNQVFLEYAGELIEVMSGADESELALKCHQNIHHINISFESSLKNPSIKIDSHYKSGNARIFSEIFYMASKFPGAAISRVGNGIGMNDSLTFRSETVDEELIRDCIRYNSYKFNIDADINKLYDDIMFKMDSELFNNSIVTVQPAPGSKFDEFSEVLLDIKKHLPQCDVSGYCNRCCIEVNEDSTKQSLFDAYVEQMTTLL